MIFQVKSGQRGAARQANFAHKASTREHRRTVLHLSATRSGSSAMDLSEAMRGYGQKRGHSQHSVENAIRLASGHLPIIVLMQEPCDHADTKPYYSMLNGDRTGNDDISGTIGCPSLRQVDKAIKAVSAGKYRIEDVAILDINTMLSASVRKRERVSEQEIVEAHAICLSMIRLKKPKVVLALTCAAQSSSLKGIRLFSSSLIEAGTVERRSVGNGDASQSFGLVKGFHPSVFLRADYIAQRGWSEVEVSLADRMFHLCVRRAFEELEDEEVSLEDARSVSRWKACCSMRSGD